MKTLIRTVLVAFALTALAAAPAVAQDSGDEEPEETNYDFSGDTIDGELMRPDGDFIDTRDFAQHTSLIEVRTEFVREIIQAAEDL